LTVKFQIMHDNSIEEQKIKVLKFIATSNYAKPYGITDGLLDKELRKIGVDFNQNARLLHLILDRLIQEDLIKSEKRVVEYPITGAFVVLHYSVELKGLEFLERLERSNALPKKNEGIAKKTIAHITANKVLILLWSIILFKTRDSVWIWIIIGIIAAYVYDKFLK
jgi:hypothetical protein